MTFDSGEEELLLGLMAGFFTANFYGFILWFGAIRYYSQLLSFLVGMIGHAVGKVAILFSRDESWLFVLVSFIISVLVALVFY